jgi:hypothetical protein
MVNSVEAVKHGFSRILTFNRAEVKKVPSALPKTVCGIGHITTVRTCMLQIFGP